MYDQLKTMLQYSKSSSQLQKKIKPVKSEANNFLMSQIHYWKVTDPDNIRIHEIPRDGGEFCRPANARPGGGDVRSRKSRQADEEKTYILNLWPFSTIHAAILARNSKNKGALSDPPIEFTTPEGGNLTECHSQCLISTLQSLVNVLSLHCSSGKGADV